MRVNQVNFLSNSRRKSLVTHICGNNGFRRGCLQCTADHHIEGVRQLNHGSSQQSHDNCRLTKRSATACQDNRY